MGEGVGRGERRWEGCGVGSGACLGLVRPLFQALILCRIPSTPAAPAPSFTDSSCIS